MKSVYVVARRLVELLQRCRVLTEDLNGAQPRQGAEYAATWARVSAYHQTLPLAPCGRAVLRSASISRECKYSELVRGPASPDITDNQLSMGNEESYCAPTREDGDGQLDCCECHRIHRDAFYASEEFLVSQCILRMLSVRILRIRVRV